MSVLYESRKVCSIYDSAMDSRWFSVNRYYSITYPYREMDVNTGLKLTSSTGM